MAKIKLDPIKTNLGITKEGQILYDELLASINEVTVRSTPQDVRDAAQVKNLDRLHKLTYEIAQADAYNANKSVEEAQSDKFNTGTASDPTFKKERVQIRKYFDAIMSKVRQENNAVKKPGSNSPMSPEIAAIKQSAHILAGFLEQTPRHWKISERGQQFLDDVAKLSGGKATDGVAKTEDDVRKPAPYQRETIRGLSHKDQEKQAGVEALYKPDDLIAIKDLTGTPEDVEARMPVKYTQHYANIMEHSEPMRTLMLADARETMDMSGAEDPSNQMRYMDVDGVIHKYEMALIYVTSTCSAHCRYCYRSDVVGGNTDKEMANPEEVSMYVRRYNEEASRLNGIDPEIRENIHLLKEVLLSGGDPMVLSNQNLAEHFVALAEAGVNKIRIGTKELAFFPDRFDDEFFEMIDKFKDVYPDVSLDLAVHFTHPDEFLLKEKLSEEMKEKLIANGMDKNDERLNDSYFLGNRKEHPYLMNWDKDTGKLTRIDVATNELKEFKGDQILGYDFEWNPKTEAAVAKFNESKRHISLNNQTPIIKDVNDDSVALRLLQSSLKKKTIEGHYFFQCRDIVGHKAFAVPVEETLKIFNESQKGLGGIDAHAKFVMSTEVGKMEVVGTTDAYTTRIEGKEVNIPAQIQFRISRGPADAHTRGDLITCERSDTALWIDDYAREARVLHDPTDFYLAMQEGRKPNEQQSNVQKSLENTAAKAIDPKQK